jgi:hypothetical protein
MDEYGKRVGAAILTLVDLPAAIWSPAGAPVRKRQDSALSSAASIASIQPIAIDPSCYALHVQVARPDGLAGRRVSRHRRRRRHGTPSARP